MPADLHDEPQLSSLLDYWERSRGARTMPRRRDIDPVAMPPSLLPHLELVELIGDRLRYRLVGTAMVDAMGRDATGRFLDQVLSGTHERFVDRVHRTALETGRPVFCLCRLHRGENGEVVVRRIVVPLANDASAPHMTLSATSLGAGRRGSAPPLTATEIGDDSIEVL